jgi:hypothetical protein
MAMKRMATPQQAYDLLRSLSGSCAEENAPRIARTGHSVSGYTDLLRHK